MRQGGALVWPLQQESNLYLSLRRTLFYPLNYRERAYLYTWPAPYSNGLCLVSGILVKLLLIVWYSRTGASEALALACAQAAGREFGDASGLTGGGEGAEQKSLNFQVVCQRCDEVGLDTLLGADAYVFVCPENLGSMAGAMKEFFDQHYYAALEKLNGRGYACIVAAGSDGQGTVRQIERIALGWRLKKMADSVIVNTQAQSPEEIWAVKTLSPAQLKCAEVLGQLAAAGLMLGIY